MRQQLANILADLLGQTIRTSNNFPGKNSRLIPLWMALRNQAETKTRILAGSGKVLCDLSVPYECMVWLHQEEQADLQVLQKLLKPGDKFIDCGANIGIWTLIAADRVGPSGNVFALEPNPPTARKLAINVRLSKFTNITMIESAAGDSPGEVFLEPAWEHNISKIVDTASSITVKVPVVKIDSLVVSNKIAGCKFDVEGFELPALKGAQQLLLGQRPWLCVEFNAVISGIQTLKDWDVHQYLTGMGYKARLFRNALNRSPDTLLTEDFSCQGYCNLFYCGV